MSAAAARARRALAAIRRLPRPIRALTAICAWAAALSFPFTNVVAVGLVAAAAGRIARGERAGPWLAVEEIWPAARLGLAMVASTLLVMALPATLLDLGWIAGWTISFEGANTWGGGLGAVGPMIGALGTILMVPALAYLPAAQTHLAAEGRLRAFFDVGRVLEIVRATPVRWWLAAWAVPLVSAVHGFGRMIATNLEMFAHFPGRGVANGPGLLVLAARLGWARAYRRAAAAPTGARRRPVALTTAFLAVAAAWTPVTVIAVFLTAYGPFFDFVAPPMLVVPTLPYAGGLWLPGDAL